MDRPDEGKESSSHSSQPGPVSDKLPRAQTLTQFGIISPKRLMAKLPETVKENVPFLCMVLTTGISFCNINSSISIQTSLRSKPSRSIWDSLWLCVVSWPVLISLSSQQRTHNKNSFTTSTMSDFALNHFVQTSLCVFPETPEHFFSHIPRNHVGSFVFTPHAYNVEGASNLAPGGRSPLKVPPAPVHRVSTKFNWEGRLQIAEV